jgi:hypothetical protein
VSDAIDALTLLGRERGTILSRAPFFPSDRRSGTAGFLSLRGDSDWVTEGAFVYWAGNDWWCDRSRHITST